MGIPANYDPEIQMMKRPPVQFDEINFDHLRFLRWMNDCGRDQAMDGWVINESSGELVDFLAEKAKRETEKTAAA